MAKIKKVEYWGGTLTPYKENLPDLPYILFTGRSNVGKSSLLNMLLQRKVAHVGKSPGKTRIINFFAINDLIAFVDLPGYGYAKVSKEMRKKWEDALRKFLYHPSIQGAVCLIDIRHPPGKNDRMLIDLLLSIPINFRVVLSKADKLSKNQQVRMRNIIARELKIPDEELIVSSAKEKIGNEEIWGAILNFLPESVREKLR